jgi:predicted dienelactone hydrolase
METTHVQPQLLDSIVFIAALAAAVWWAIARRHWPRGLDRVSLGAAALAVLALAVDGPRWQLVPWQIIAAAAAAAAVVRRLRTTPSRRWARAVGRVGLVACAAVGGLALLSARVPELPLPSGPHHVGSQVFRWTDAQRPETFTEDPTDRREVVAQAWYPTDATSGGRVPYFEAQDRLPPFLGVVPGFYGGFGEVDTHAVALAPVSAARATWPVLVFLPGWGTPREQYTALCTDLASRGYVVVALTHPYESGVALLADGRVVGPVTGATMFGGQMADLADVRTADARFVLDRLGDLQEAAPGSPLAGHLDLRHAAVVGHSLGGATATQVVAADPRVLAGVNLDGVLTDAQADARLVRPFLWLQSDGAQGEQYARRRDRLFGGLQGGGDLLVIEGSSHGSFADDYLSDAGRALLGGDAPSADQVVTTATADLVAGFMAPLLRGPGGSLDAAVARHPAVRPMQHVPAAQGA